MRFIVWAVVVEDWEDTETLGLFTTQEKAEAFRNELLVGWKDWVRPTVTHWEVVGHPEECETILDE